MWDDFTWEEIREGSQVGQTSEKVEKNVALATKEKNKKKYMSQVGHYASKFPEKKKGKTEKDSTATATVEDFASKFEHDFSLVSIDSSIVSSSFEHI